MPEATASPGSVPPQAAVGGAGDPPSTEGAMENPRPGSDPGDAPAATGRDRPSIAERAARRNELQGAGRDRYGSLLRSLQAGHELPIYRRDGRITIDWHPVLGTLIKVTIVVVFAYLAIRAGNQWWRENHVDTWSGPDATVRSGVRLADCPLVDSIRVDDFPSWIVLDGSVYRYTGWKRPFVGSDTPGYTITGYANGSLHLVLIDNTPDGVARDTILLWLQGALAGIEYARTPDCSPPP